MHVTRTPWKKVMAEKAKIGHTIQCTIKQKQRQNSPIAKARQYTHTHTHRGYLKQKGRNLEGRYQIQRTIVSQKGFKEAREIIV